MFKKFKDFQKKCRDKNIEKQKLELYKIIVDFCIVFFPKPIFNVELLILPYFSEEFLEETLAEDFGYKLVSCEQTYNSFFSKFFNRPSHIIVLKNLNEE